MCCEGGLSGWVEREFPICFSVKCSVNMPTRGGGGGEVGWGERVC